MQVLPGSVITLFEYEPAPGVKVSRIVSLTDDLSLALRCVGLRILAPVPGKPVVGIEIPNMRRETIYFKDVMTSDVFQESTSKLTLVIGKDITGNRQCRIWRLLHICSWQAQQVQARASDLTL